MNIATLTYFDAQRERLDCRRAELRADIDAAQRANLPRAEPGRDEVTDRKDEAEQSATQQISTAEAQRDLDELAQVEAALRRIDLDVYGECLACGEAIPLERLRAQPAALRCTACQVASEAHAAMASASR